jgi:hypothetical protein
MAAHRGEKVVGEIQERERERERGESSEAVIDRGS